MEQIDECILGGGIAGLACAQELKEHGHGSAVFEKEAAAGGLCSSFEVSGFVFDSAVHLSFTTNELVRRQFDKVTYLKHNPESINFYYGQYIKHPILNNLYKLTAEEKCELLESFLQRDERQEIRNYADWCAASYGNEIKKRFYDVYTKKYWTVPSEQLSTTWIGARLNTPNLHKVLYGAFTDNTGNDYYAKEMRYPTKGGYQGFIQPLINGADIRLNKRAVEIDVNKKEVHFDDGSFVHYNNLFCSIPLCEMADIIKDTPYKIRVAAHRLQYSSVSIVSVGFNRPNIPKALWTYIYDEDIFAARINSPSIKSPNNVPNDCSSLQFEIYHHNFGGGEYNHTHFIDSYNNKAIIDKEKILTNVKYAIKKMELANENDIIFMHYRLLPYGNVIFYNGMENDRKIVRDFVRSCQIIPIGRFGEWDYLWSDQTYISGVKGAQSINL